MKLDDEIIRAKLENAEKQFNMGIIERAEYKKIRAAIEAELLPEKTYWIVTVENEKVRATHSFDCEGPFFRSAEMKYGYGENAILLFVMQLTREQYEAFQS